MNPYELEVYARSRQRELLAEAETFRRIEQARAVARRTSSRSGGEARRAPSGGVRPAAVPRSARRQSIIARIARAASRLFAQATPPSREAVAGRSRPA